MSINFHAYQCRDYLLSDYEEIEKQWKTEFTGYDPERTARILNLEKDETYLYVRYFQTLYRLRLKDGTLEKQFEETAGSHRREKPSHAGPLSSSCLKIHDREKLYLQDTAPAHISENGWTDRVYFNECMVIYHLLHYVKDHPSISGIWIPNSQLDTRAGSHNQRKDILLTSFSSSFAGKMEQLEMACKKLGGICVETKADLSWEFHPFPQVPLRLLFWDEDEDFPAQVQILVDSQVTDYVHLETTGCMVSDLFEKLTALANPPENS